MYLCKICQASTSLIKDSKKELIYYRCSICGFVFLDDRYIVNEIEEKKKYDQHNNSLENEGYVQMFEDFIDLSIEPYRKHIQRVLEFGSGPEPVLAELLKRRNLEVDIYDLYYSPKKVYENKSYDLITSTEVFEHLSKPLEVLELLVEHTNKNGYIALMTKFPPKDDKEFLAWWYRRDPTHISFFTPESFEVMAEKVGLRVLKTINKNIVVFQKV
ncbi:MAG TPA: class I SAM-dependent methyltransferase [Campylobacterales bacterium]|nr:class I SAM-dependent methyltransferase [Campylobacterales bacterium]